MRETLISKLFDFLTVKRTEMVGDDGDIVSTVFEAPERDPDDDSVWPEQTDETDGSEWWTPYGLYCRPPDGSESLVVRAGDAFIAIASRVLGLKDLVGKLSPGDVALYSMGGNVLRLNADGKVSLLVRTKNNKHFVAVVDPKGSGTFKAMNGAGMCVEMSEENGIVLNAGDKNITLAGKNIAINGMSLNCNVASNKTWMGASSPLVPTSAAPGLFV